MSNGVILIIWDTKDWHLSILKKKRIKGSFNKKRWEMSNIIDKMLIRNIYEKLNLGLFDKNVQ